MENRMKTRRRAGMPGISIMRFGFHASTSEAAKVETAETATEQDAKRCAAIYANEPCGGLIVEAENDWPRCERCGTN